MRRAFNRCFLNSAIYWGSLLGDRNVFLGACDITDVDIHSDKHTCSFQLGARSFLSTDLVSSRSFAVMPPQQCVTFVVGTYFLLYLTNVYLATFLLYGGSTMYYTIIWRFEKCIGNSHQTMRIAYVCNPSSYHISTLPPPVQHKKEPSVQFSITCQKLQMTKWCKTWWVWLWQVKHYITELVL